jgi:hypothetical protein
MKSLNEFIQAQNITLQTQYADRNPNMESSEWSNNASHFKCLLSSNGKRLTTFFSMGSAHTGGPTLNDVLGSLAMDAAGIENARDFQDWASEYGYDTDSRKAERTFKACQRISKKLHQFLGAEAYQALLFDTEND